MANKCVIILSTKSSGSSACQRFLSLTGNVKCVRKTRHSQHETLYWSKAASVLGLPQIKVLDSEVPIERSRAKAELRQLLSDNVENYTPPANDEELIFDGWSRLCTQYAPVFLEKSPHHLIQWSALELIRTAMERLPQIRFHIVGLVRNPMDTLYSAWRRWRSDPQKNQYQWLVAYSNLFRLKHVLGDAVNIVRYEDMVCDADALSREFAFAGIDGVTIPADYFHRKSVSQWKTDKFFGFSLSDEVVDLARQFGYPPESLTNTRKRIWLPYRVLARAQFKSTQPLLNAMRAQKGVRLLRNRR